MRSLFKNNDQKMSSSCSVQKADLVACLAASECVQKGGLVSDCLKARDVSEECLVAAAALRACRTDQLNMRSRFRGNAYYKPAVAEAPKAEDSDDDDL